MIEKRDEHERKGKISNSSLKNSINLKYEAISVPQGSVRLVKKTQERKSHTCYLLITKGVTSSSLVPQKTRRVGSEANPQVYVETPLHPEKLTVWCALWAGGILLKNDEDHNVTVNGDRYRAMIINFFIPELNNHDVQQPWFQQDRATCHTARATIDLLKDTLGDRLISRFEPVNWPPRSCDLTPLDYFLWGYVKSLVLRISHKRLTIWKATFAVLLPIYGHKCWKKSSKIGRPDWTTSEPVVAVYARNHI
ncbi:uncharacterized protein TNCV_1319831 [Trichonephila clavipes]|nr:uncharacterized protein TNCV_1319831 [Trichonephila clavipes]